MRQLLIMITVFVGAMALLGYNKAATDNGVTSTGNDQTLQQETDVVFTGKEDHSITLVDAMEMTAAFRREKIDGPWAWFYGREAVENILAQDGVVGVRIYGGLNQEGRFSPVLVGVTADGEDLAYGVLAELTTPCPPCSNISPLMGYSIATISHR